MECKNSDCKGGIKQLSYSLCKWKKRIAYVESFGTNDIPEEDRAIFEKQLEKFKAIGLRKTAGLDIVQRLIGKRDAEVVLDPMRLLSTVEWIRIAQKPSFA